MSDVLKNKLLDMEVAPPTTAWDFIAHSLEQNKANPVSSIQQKMHTVEVPPPATVWYSIEELLNKDAENVIPFRGNRPLAWIRWAAAAIFIGLIATGAFWYFSNPPAGDKNISNSLAQTEKIQPNSNSNVPGNKQPDSVQELNSGENNNSDASSYSSTHLTPEQEDAYTKGLLAVNDIPLKRVLPDPVNYEDDYSPAEGVKLVARNMNDNIATGINAITADNNYFITTGPNGEVVRVSNKLAGVISMMDDNSIPDYINMESIEWKQRLYTLRSKISNVAPAPENFLDIIQLANLLKEAKMP